MRRRLLQLVVLAALVTGVVVGAPANSAGDGPTKSDGNPWLWCFEWQSCEPAPSCKRLAQFEYRMCCTILDYCETYRRATRNCCD